MFELFAKLVNGFYPLNNFAKWSIKNVWPGPKFDFGPLVVNPLSANPQKGQAHSNNLSAKDVWPLFGGGLALKELNYKNTSKIHI